MKRPRKTIIFQPVLEKSPTSGRLGIAPPTCSLAGFLEKGRPNGRPRRVPSIAARSPGRAGAAIRGWPGNRGLCSSRATEVLSQEIPATTPSSSAISAPVGQSNFFGVPSPPVRIAQTGLMPVFTQTQTRPPILIISACHQRGIRLIIHMAGLKSGALIGNIRSYDRRPHCCALLANIRIAKWGTNFPARLTALRPAPSSSLVFVCLVAKGLRLFKGYSPEVEEPGTNVFPT